MQATAAVLHDFGAPLIIEQIQLAAPASHEVRVRIRASGVCGTDYTVADTGFGFPVPILLGHEISGVVEEIGSEVKGIEVGDQVVACPVNHCGRCENCLTGKPVLCLNHGSTVRPPGETPRVAVGAQPVAQLIGIGGFAEQIVLHENLVVPISKEIPFEVACLLGCGVATGLGTVLNAARVQHGDTVLVVGCGGVGLNAVQGARIAGARRIIALDRSQDALDLALKFGATHGIHADDNDPVAQVKALTGGQGVTHAFEMIGLPQTLELSLAALRNGGSVYLVGFYEPGSNLSIPSKHFFDRKSIHGVTMGSTIPKVHIPEYADLYLQGRLKLDELVANRITLAEVNDGLDRLRSGGIARSVILFD